MQYRNSTCASLVLTAGLLLAPARGSAQTTTCVPRFVAPPWTSGSISTLQSGVLAHEHPLWLGSGVFGFADGGARHTEVRYVHGADTFGERVVLSFWRGSATNAMGVTYDPIIFVALRSGADRLVLKIAPDTSNPSVTPVALNHCQQDGCSTVCSPASACRGQVSVFTSDLDDSTFDLDKTGALGIDVQYRALQAGPGPFLVQVTLPVGAMSGDLLDGLPATGGKLAFRSGWANGAGLTFEQAEPSCGAGCPATQVAGALVFDAPWAYHDVHLGPGAPAVGTCATDLDLSPGDVGVLNELHKLAPDNEIYFDPTAGATSNYFIVRPKNTTGASLDVVDGAGLNVTASFFLADWGTQPTVMGPQWSLLGDADPTQTLPPSWGSTFNTASPVADQQRINLVTNHSFPFNVGCLYVPSLAGGASCPGEPRSQHQCVLVQLGSTLGLDIRPSSVFRNMRFVTASTFESEAKATIEGLPALPGRDTRDLYLVVYTTRMPPSVPAQEQAGEAALVRELGETVAEIQDLVAQSTAALLSRRFPAYVRENIQQNVALQAVARGALAGYPAPESQAPPETWLNALLDLYPRFEVVALHETGETVDFEGQVQPVLSAQTSFGYYVTHPQGALTGWSFALDGPLQEVRPGMYKLTIPNGGFARIGTRIKAHEADEDPPLVPDKAYGGVFDAQGQPWTGAVVDPEPAEPRCKCSKTSSAEDAGLPLTEGPGGGPLSGVVLLLLLRRVRRWL